MKKIIISAKDIILKSKSVKEILLKIKRIVNNKILKQAMPALRTKEVIEKKDKQKNTIYFSKGKKTKVKAPDVRSIPQEFKKMLGEHEVERKVAYTLKNVEIYGRFAIAVSENGRLVLEEMDNYSTLRSIIKKTPKKHYKHLFSQLRKVFGGARRLKKKESKIEKKATINLVPRHFGGPNRSNHGNYAHWIAEDLPRLQAAEKYQNVTGIKPQVIIKKNPPSWMAETLRLMGLSSSDLIEWKGGAEVIPKLLVPELRNYHSGGTALDPAGRNWVSRTMKRNIDMSKSNEFPNRVFASRQGSGLRKIANYNEVEDVLNDFGVVPVKNESLSVKDQIRLYDQADIIIGMFGANLANMIFSSSTKVIEIFQRGDIRPVYFLTANEMGHEYSFLEGTKNVHKSSKNHTETIVNTENLRKTIERLLD